MKTLAKIQSDKWLGGVCSGFAYMLGVPTWTVRLAVALLVLFGMGCPIAVYVLLWIFMPRWQMDPVDYAARTQPAAQATTGTSDPLSKS